MNAAPTVGPGRVRLAGATAALAVLAVVAGAGPFATPAAAAEGEAAERFGRGLRRFNEDDNAGALAEFLRSYQLAPTPLVLYNIGLVQAQLGRPVEAAAALDKVLGSPGNLTPDKLERARRTRDEQAARIGHLLIKTNVEAQVEVDNVEVGRTPLAAAVALAGGVRLLAVVAPGHAPTRREIELAAGQSLTLEIALQPIETALAHITVDSQVPGADIVLDGHVVGRTPLQGSLAVAPGEHSLVLRRAGYRDERSDLALAGGAARTVSFALAEAPTGDAGVIAMAVSEPDATVVVDGRPRPEYRTGMRLAAGVHRVSVMRTGFFSVERDVVSVPGTARTVRVTLEPTEETRVAHVDRATGQRRWAWVTLALGALVAGGSALVYLRNRDELQGARAEREEVRSMLGQGGQCAAALEQSPRCQMLVTHANDRLDQAERTLRLTQVGMGVGAGVLITGAVLRAVAQDPAKYDYEPVREAPEPGVHVLAAAHPGGAVIGLAGRF